MLRTVCVLLILLSGRSAAGQSTWSVSGGIAPAFVRTHYSSTVLFPDSDGQLVEPVELTGRANAFSYAIGLTLSYTYAPGWSVATGVWHRAQITRQPRQTVVSVGTTMLRERAVRIPLLFTYRSATRRLSPYYSLGLLLDLPRATRVIERRTTQPTQHLQLDGGPGPVFNILLGAGGVYQINPRWAVLVQPTGTYRLGHFGDAQTHNPALELGLMAQVVRSF